MTVRHSGLVQRVGSALQEEPVTRDAAVDVVDENGTITLTGLVASDDALQAAKEVAQQQEGVIQVINELRVEEGDQKGEKPAVVPLARGANLSFMGARPEILN